MIALKEKTATVPLQVLIDVEVSPYRGIDHLIHRVRIGDIDVTEQLSAEDWLHLQTWVNEHTAFWEAA